MRIGIAIHRAVSLDPTWTTVHLAGAFLARGHAVRFVEKGDFEIDAKGHLVARSFLFDPPACDDETLCNLLTERTAPRRTLNVEALDLLLLRCAPLDDGLMTFARLARNRGVPVVNDPDGILAVGHKAWLAAQQVPTPATLVTRSFGAAQIFHGEQRHGVVIKPGRGSGGRAVARVRRGDGRRLYQAFEAARAVSKGYVVVQAYVPEASEGEKRLVWLDGAIIGGYLRRRAPGEFRHNLKRGGTAFPATITDDEHHLAQALSPLLLDAGIRMAGLDVIGGLVTEVNALNPGGTFHADRLSGTRLAERVAECLERIATEPVAEQHEWAHRVP